MICDAARERMFELLADARTPERCDQLLDIYLDLRDRATEWDGAHWGFNPDHWMVLERQKMEYNIAMAKKR